MEQALIFDPGEPGGGILSSMAALAGCRPESFVDAGAAARAFGERRHEVLLVRPAGRAADAAELCTAVRSLPGGEAAVLLLVLDGFPSEAERDSLIRGVADDWLITPLDSREFRARLELARRRRQDSPGAATVRASPESILARLPGAVVTVDASGAILYRSSGARAVLGTDPGPDLAAEILPRLYPPDRPRLRELAVRLLSEATPSATASLRMRHADGSWRTLEAAALALPPNGNGETRILIQARDASDQERGELQLRERSERLSRVFHQSAHAIALHEADGTILEVNRRFMEMFELPGERIVGRNLREFCEPPSAPETPEVAGADDGAPRWSSLGRGAVEEYGSRWRRADGSSFPADVTATIIDLGEDGRVVASTIRDVGEQAVLQEQLSLSLKMEAVGRLAGGIAHGFNNLLTAVNGYSELLLQQLPIGSPLRAHAEEIHRAGARATTLTGQLLAFGRRQRLQPVVVNANAILAELAEPLRQILGDSIELVTRMDATAPPVLADPAQIEQVLRQLAANARESMPDGGTLTLETARVQLGPEAANRHAHPMPPGCYLDLTVSDTGGGMEAAVAERIFEPFFTTRAATGAAGLGLATVYGIVKQSDGFIFAASRLGEGTSFHIYLPRVARFAMPPTAGRPASAPRPAPTILVAEDNDLVRRLVTTALRDQGYRILEAANGREALALATAHGPVLRLLLTDLVMPGMGGIELARELSGRDPELKVIVMSGRSAADERHELGPDVPFLPKPFLVRDLLRMVRGLLAEGPVGEEA